MTPEQRAVEALKAFPLLSPKATSMDNYRRIIRWLHDGRPNVASLIIDLEFPQYAEGK